MLNINTAPEILTTTEVAELLGVNPQTIKRYIQAGKMKAVRLPDENGRVIRIFKKDIMYLFGGTK